jgi:hypothetical protein
MRYMLLLYDCDRPEPGDPRFGDALERVNGFVEECHRRGVLRAGDPLQPVSTATTLRVRDGQTLIVDGPFAEVHEQLGGYFILDCRDLDEALELAALCPWHKKVPSRCGRSPRCPPCTRSSTRCVPPSPRNDPHRTRTGGGPGVP